MHSISRFSALLFVLVVSGCGSDRALPTPTPDTASLSSVLLSVPGCPCSDVASSRAADGHVELFLRSTGNGTLWRVWQAADGSFPSSNVQQLTTGPISYAPAPLLGNDGLLHVFFVSPKQSNTLWDVSSSSGANGAWSLRMVSHGGYAIAPHADSIQDGRAAVFIQGGDGAVWLLLQAPGQSISQANWYSLGRLPGTGGSATSVVGPVSTATTPQGTFAVLARDSNGSTWLSVLPNVSSSFGAWTLIGGAGYMQTPAVLTTEADGRLVAIGQGGGGTAVWMIEQTAPGGPWQSLFSPLYYAPSGQTYGRPQTALDASGRIEVFFPTSQGVLRNSAETALSSWAHTTSGFTAGGGSLSGVATVAAAIGPDNRVVELHLDASGTPRLEQQVTPGRWNACACSGWQVCTVDGTCVAPPEQTRYRVGACYHSTDLWDNSDSTTWTSFIPHYHEAGVRQKVQQQLAAMVASNADLVKTILWYGFDPINPGYSLVHFPPTPQELTNLRNYVIDVASTLRSNGQPMDLLLSSDWLTLADRSIGDVNANTLGWGCMPVASYAQAVNQTYSSVLSAVQDIFRPDGLPVVSLMYLESEIQVCASDDNSDPACNATNGWMGHAEYANHCVMPVPDGTADLRAVRNIQWFTNAFYPPFVAAARRAGVIPSVYFNGGLPSPIETTIVNNTFTDSYAAQVPAFGRLSGHIGMTNVFRTMYWMQQHGLELPARVDVDLNLTENDAVFTSPGTIITHFLDDIEATLPYFYPNQPFRYGIPEVTHPLDPTRRYEEGKAWAAERLLRGANPEFVTFWSSPGATAASNVAPSQYDFAAFSTANIAFPFAGFASGGFETSNDGVLPDGWHTLVPSTEPTNGYWNTNQVLFGAADLRFDASRCAAGCASIESDRVAVQPGQTLVFHLWQRNGYVPTGSGVNDPAYSGMLFSLVPSTAGVDGNALLQFGAVNNSGWQTSPSTWTRYTGVYPLPSGAGPDSVRLSIGMNGAPPATAMEVDELR